MSEFKFICREEELNFAKEALLDKNFIIYHYFNDSGLTHYLKKLTMDLNTKNELCFYIDCAKKQSISVQIATQIISSSDKQKISTYTQNCIFRKNRALAPHERSAVPLGTDHCPVG